MFYWEKRSVEHDPESSEAGDRLLSDTSSDHSLSRDRPRTWASTLWSGRYLHGALILFYTALYLTLMYAIPKPSCSTEATNPHLPLPDRAGLQWEERKFPTNIVDNPFTGNPRDELDEAWHKLLRNDNIRVPKDYLDEHNLKSVYTKDGTEGIASLSVFHSLHCLKKVKKMLFKEYYHGGKSEEAMAREEKHVDHCVEYIRESLMCQPDLSMVTFRWINNTAQHEDKSEFYPTNFDVDMHRCANWQHLDSWAGERMFNLFEVDLLERPEPVV
ncbi:hypothetical protein EV127DRAFT_6292 [Xylaria flabelliformis]|nr:hypothetical protein EV127DRAFT_6292 [Xylaria flabelliformis]